MLFLLNKKVNKFTNYINESGDGNEYFQRQPIRFVVTKRNTQQQQRSHLKIASSCEEATVIQEAMSDEEGGVGTEEALKQKHKQERKELQNEIQKLKHSVPKNDKKRKKELTEQIAKMEVDLDERQGRELLALTENTKAVEQVTSRVDDLQTDDQTSMEAQGAKKLSKAQKRRDKKASKDKEREERIKEQEQENLSGVRHTEYLAIKSALKSRGLQIHEIKSDGNCLYNAINHQLQGKASSCGDLRNQAAAFMKDHKEDFLPFLAKDNGDPFSESDFDNYCEETAKTTAWGGQLEVRALSHVLQQPFEIIQAEGPPIKIGDEYDGINQSHVVLCYLRHAFGLGEHYNSVESYKDNEDEFS